jgi:hypothetical protein
MLYRAAQVIAREPKIRAWLEENDPMALAQLDKAILEASTDLKLKVRQGMSDDWETTVLDAMVGDARGDWWFAFFPKPGSGAPITGLQFERLNTNFVEAFADVKAKLQKKNLKQGVVRVDGFRAPIGRES